MIADQPVYGIAKQWCNPDQRKKHFMLRPLHTELVFMGLIGDWVNGRG